MKAFALGFSRTLCSFLLALVVSSLLLGSAHADDSAFVSEKLLHVVGGGGISFAVGYATKKPWLGLASGCAAGVAKEVHDNFVSNETFAGHMRDIGITCGASTVGYFLLKKLVRSDNRRPALHAK
jgi:hypothetical protein